jgi:hypothetical protein
MLSEQTLAILRTFAALPPELDWRGRAILRYGTDQQRLWCTTAMLQMPSFDDRYPFYVLHTPDGVLALRYGHSILVNLQPGHRGITQYQKALLALLTEYGRTYRGVVFPFVPNVRTTAQEMTTWRMAAALPTVTWETRPRPVRTPRLLLAVGDATVLDGRPRF